MSPADIAAGAFTVTHVAEHFDELKRQVLALHERAGVRDRQYFTPSEDEATRHLLASYWQARNALLELVMTFRHEVAAPSDAVRKAGFLVAYAAAAVLVDAAKTLRQTVGGDAVVIRKFNEPEPHFGIPPGTYDAIEASLTSPIHAWHLYHANQYFQEHQAELRTLAQGAAVLAPVMALLDRLRGQLTFSKRALTRARLEFDARRLLSGLQNDALGQTLYWMQETVSKMLSEWSTDLFHHPHLPPEIAAEVAALLLPGDVIVVRKEHAVTNYFLPGYWPHAALYLGDPDCLQRMGVHEHEHVRPRWARLLEPHDDDRVTPPARRVLEAMKDGVRIRPLRSPFSSDAIAIIRPQLSRDLVAQALCRGMFHEGKPYDFDFDFTRSDRLVCTEVVYRSYEGIGGMSFKLTNRVGRMTLAAEDLLTMALERCGFEPVAAFAPDCGPGLARRGAADELLRATIGRSPWATLKR